MRAAVVPQSIDISLLAGVQRTVDLIDRRHHASGIAVDDRVRRHILRDDRARANQGVLPDDHPGQNGHVDADARTALDGRPTGMRAFGA